MEYEILKISNQPQYIDAAANYFSDKWNIPIDAYLDSMNDSLTSTSGVPSWYVAVVNESIIGGLGVIENDFHDRKDLTPNVCAVYVNSEYRGLGIAGRLLDFVCDDMASKGINTLYLVTYHDSFYEKYGWNFLCMVQGDGEENLSRMYIKELRGKNE